MGQVFDRPTGCADWRPARSRSAGAPTSTSAARRAPAATAAATPSTTPSCCGPTATATTPSPRSSDVRPGAGDRHRLGHRAQLPCLLAADRAAGARRGRARQPAPRARARRRPRVGRRRTHPARPGHVVAQAPAADARSMRSSRHPPPRRCRRRRRRACRPAGAAHALRSPAVVDERDDPLQTIAPEVYVRRLLGVEVPRHRKVSARSTRIATQACTSTTRPSAAGTATGAAAAAARSTTSPARSTATPPPASSSSDCAASCAASSAWTRSDDRPADERAFRYVHCDIPAGMTIAQWRASRAEARDPRPSTLQALRRRLATAIAAVNARHPAVPPPRRAARA